MITLHLTEKAREGFERGPSRANGVAGFFFGAAFISCLMQLSAPPPRSWTGLVIPLAAVLLGFLVKLIARGSVGSRSDNRSDPIDNCGSLVLDALQAHIAVIDEKGKIVTVNQAWRDFAIANGARPETVCEGANYLSVVAADKSRAGEAISNGLRSLLAGEIKRFNAEYPCDSPDERRWFVMRGSRYESHEGCRVVLAHYDLTERHLLEEHLIESEQRYRTIAQLTSDIIYEWQVDSDEIRTFMDGPSGTSREVLGEFRLQDMIERVHPDDRDGYTVALDRALRTGEEVNYEFRVIEPDGTTRILVDHGRGIADQNGRTQLWYGAVRDVTAIRLAEKELIDREHMLSAILRTALEAVIITDSTGRIVEWNRSAEEIFGWPREQIVGRLADTVIAESHRWVFTSGIRGLQRSINRRIELMGVRKDGVEFPAEVALTAVQSNGVYFAAFIRDVSEEKQAEQENTRYSSIINNSLDAIVSLDPEGRVVSWNAAAAEVYGKTAEEMIGKSMATALTEDRIAVFYDGLEKVARGEKVSLFEYCRKTASGKMIWLAVSCSPVRDADGRIVGSSSIIRDITAQRATAEAIRQQEDAERANLAKSEFLSRISHELRTPLNSVLGFAQLIELRSDDLQTQSAVHQISKAGRHLLQIINEILDISHLDTGRLQLCEEYFDLSLAVSEAVEVIRLDAEAMGVDICAMVPQGTTTFGDRQYTTQILVHLLSNAVKFNREGGSVEVRFINHDDRRQLTIRDTGTGMDVSFIHRLFAPFERLGAESSHIEGTGLGLALSRKYAEAMGGGLTLASTGPTGSVFSLELPIGPRALARNA